MVIIDTTGSITLLPGHPDYGAGYYTWTDLEPGFQGFIHAAIDELYWRAAVQGGGFVIASIRCFASLAPEAFHQLYNEYEWLCTDCNDRRQSREIGVELWKARQKGEVQHLKKLVLMLSPDRQVVIC